MNDQAIRLSNLVSDASCNLDLFGANQSHIDQAATVTAVLVSVSEHLSDAARCEDSRIDVVTLLRATALLADRLAADIADDCGINLDSPAELERFDDAASQLIGAI